jgi:hypothetical protein
MKKLIKKSKPESASVNLDLDVEQQPDNHSCGFHACSSIYRYYGLDPRRLRLRSRMGVDKFPKGSLPFDVFAVLFGDGFEMAWGTGPFDPGLKTLRAHLRKGRPALALFGKTLEHWIAVAGYEKDCIRVADSSYGYAFRNSGCKGRNKELIPYEKFAAHVHGILLLHRRKNAKTRDMGKADFAFQYLKAVAFSAGSLKSAGLKWLK